LQESSKGSGDRNGVFNVDLLIERLEKYKSGVKETDVQLQRQKNLLPKEVEDVVAAARFRQEIERGGLDLSVGKRMFDTSSDTPRSPISSSADSNFGNSPDWAEGAGTRGADDTNNSAKFPTRSSSIATFLNRARPSSSRQTHALLSQTENLSGTVVAGQVKTHQRSITIGDPRHSISSTIVSTFGTFDDPGKVAYTSGHTGEFKPASHNPLLMGSPKEDQIRRELEALAIKEGANLLEQSKHDSGWRTPVVQVIELETEDGDEYSNGRTAPVKSNRQREPIQRAATGGDDFVWRTNDNGRSRLWRPFGIFRSFRKRTTADELIDMYMSDDQLKEFRISKHKVKMFKGFR
jgi:hypothetical protein